MPSYRLHRMMRFTNGKPGTAFERDVIVADDLASAIDEAMARTVTPPGLVLTSVTLSAGSGAFLWSSNALDADANRLSPTMS